MCMNKSMRTDGKAKKQKQNLFPTEMHKLKLTGVMETVIVMVSCGSSANCASSSRSEVACISSEENALSQSSPQLV